MFTFHRLIQITLIITGLIVSTWTLAAANLSISPVQIDLTPATKMGAITLMNKGETPVNLFLDAKSWDIDEEGQFIETDTGDFIFYPKTLTIAGKGQATIRVGYTGVFPELEKPFRIIIQEIPQIIQADPEKNKTKFGVSVALRLSIPLYVIPFSNMSPAKVELGDLKIDNNVLRVGVKNLTGYHVNLKKVAVKLMKQDQVLAEKVVPLTLQRVFGQRLLFINVPMDVKKICAQADTIDVQIEADNLAETYQTKRALKQGCQL